MVKRSKTAQGYCRDCQKCLYGSRKEARRVARAHHNRMPAYPCPVVTTMWHLGHLPGRVVYGDITRGAFYGTKEDRMEDRCMNCGEPGHYTQYCTHYGPHFPEPGKTRADYQETYEKIMNQIATDIVADHPEPEEVA